MSDKEPKQRKERVIHTRVPESLDEEIRKRAAGLGISVSNLVRNVLKNAMDLVDDVITDSASVARSVSREPAPPAPSPAADPGRTLGWQPLVLQLNAICSRCNAIMPKGTDAALAVTERPAAAPTLICSECLVAATGGS